MRIINAVSPVNLGSSANGRYVSLKNVTKAFIVAQVTVCSATAVTVAAMRATDVAGTGGVAFSTSYPLDIWYTNGCSSDETLTKATTEYISKAFSATTGEKQVVFEVPSVILDTLNSSFDCLGVNFSNVTTDETGSAFYLLKMRYAEADTPSVMID
jgi:hypothetical protein